MEGDWIGTLKGNLKRPRIRPTWLPRHQSATHAVLWFPAATNIPLLTSRKLHDGWPNVVFCLLAEWVAHHISSHLMAAHHAVDRMLLSIECIACYSMPILKLSDGSWRWNSNMRPSRLTKAISETADTRSCQPPGCSKSEMQRGVA